MWFKQIQLFQLSSSIPRSAVDLTEKLQLLEFKACLPSMPFSMGWVPLVDEADAPLVRGVNHCMMMCLQVEEKILPATVVRQAVAEKIKRIAVTEDRKVFAKEKLALKDEMAITLLPRAFTKLTRIYAYIDTQRQWLVLGTTNTKKAEQFLSLCKKTITDDIQPLELKNLSAIMADWLKNKTYPSSLAVEKAAVLQDINQKNRIIRCQQQDLFVNSIQSLLKEGCEVKQLALSWQDQINFVLTDNFSLCSIRFQDEIKEQAKDMEPETKQQQFDADFFIMTTILTNLLQELLSLLVKPQDEQALHTAPAVAMVA